MCVCVVSQSSPPPIFSLLSMCNSPSLPPSLPLPLSLSLLPPSLPPSLSPPFLLLSPDARGTMPSRASLPCSPPEEWTPPSSSPRCAERRGVGQGSRRRQRGPFQQPRTKHHVSVCVCACVHVIASACPIMLCVQVPVLSLRPSCRWRYLMTRSMTVVLRRAGWP